MNKVSPVPHFYLYGDEEKDVEIDTVHIEPIRERSLRHDWIIHPHVHPDHLQVLFFTGGGATIDIEGETITAEPRCLVVQPAGMVHGIHFLPGTEGKVATVATSYLASIARDDPRLIETVNHAAAYPLRKGDQDDVNAEFAFDQIMREANWTEPGRRTAIRAHFLSLLVVLLRRRAASGIDGPRYRDRNYDLVSRYKALLETSFREHKMLSYYARELGVSPQRLNAACRVRAGKTASEALHDRIVAEAKRNLIYTEMTIAEIGHSLGYDDPAYFNRFFSQRVGMPPGTYRANAATTRRVSR
ncbi:helix-turn-helix domain-containing protein [Oricola sp.]|uniref:helix-turn-helix domain-containing protein n=1 Tax=Oricola sp. TaxID=1979950 RepID=UPI0025D9599D|nr:helix-turn-helix domain-containing protein [Oricola sp.]MCI5076505.1 helix-turn-helix domain-containing protein [Oricola sp.]